MPTNTRLTAHPTFTMLQLFFVIYLFLMLFSASFTSAFLVTNFLKNAPEYGYSDGFHLNPLNSAVFTNLVVANIIYSLLFVPLGYLGHKLGIDWLYNGGHIFLALGSGLGVFVGNWQYLLASRLITTFGECLLLPQLFPMAEPAFPNAHGKARWICYHVFVFAIVPGMIIATVLGDVLYCHPKAAFLIVFAIDASTLTVLLLLALLSFCLALMRQDHHVPSEVHQGHDQVLEVLRPFRMAGILLCSSISCSFFALVFGSIAFGHVGLNTAKQALPLDTTGLATLSGVGGLLFLVLAVITSSPAQPTQTRELHRPARASVDKRREQLAATYFLWLLVLVGYMFAGLYGSVNLWLVRLSDKNRSPWLLLLSLIPTPAYILISFFARGTLRRDIKFPNAVQDNNVYRAREAQYGSTTTSIDQAIPRSANVFLVSAAILNTIMLFIMALCAAKTTALALDVVVMLFFSLPAQVVLFRVFHIIAQTEEAQRGARAAALGIVFVFAYIFSLAVLTLGHAADPNDVHHLTQWVGLFFGFGTLPPFIAWYMPIPPEDDVLDLDLQHHPETDLVIDPSAVPLTDMHPETVPETPTNAYGSSSETYWNSIGGSTTLKGT